MASVIVSLSGPHAVSILDSKTRTEPKSISTARTTTSLADNNNIRQYVV